LTSRLNQDVAESTFSLIRGLGSTYPGPSDLIHTLISLVRNRKILVENSSVVQEVKDETMTNDFDTSLLLICNLVSATHPEPL
jgi:hypothetical protein